MTLERISVLKNVPSVRNGCCWGQHGAIDLLLLSTSAVHSVFK